MGIPILNELNEELERLYIAGSPLAKGDPRIKKYLPPLGKLAEKAPVFGALAGRLEALADGDDRSSPENLMEAGLLLHAVLYTQGTTDTGYAYADMAYADTPLRMAAAPHSRLSRLIALLESESQAHDDTIREVYEAGQYNDPRLYKAYASCLRDNRTYLSDYVETVVIPAIGPEIAPFLEEALDIAGEGRRHARLFRALHAVRGREVLPLAERVLAEAAQPQLIAAAVAALGEDARYEEVLLTYAGDKKGDVRQAAFAALARLGSAKGIERLIAGLGKANIAALEEALALAEDTGVVRAVHGAYEAAMKDVKKNAGRLKVLLRVLAARDEEAGLARLEGVLGDPRFYGDTRYLLELDDVARVLYVADTPSKNALLLRIARGNEALGAYHLQAAARLMDAQELYGECHKLVAGSRQYLYGTLAELYGLNPYQYTHVPDAEKTWDRRWAAVCMQGGRIPAAFQMLYDDDGKGWKNLLGQCVELTKKNTRQGEPAGPILERAFINGHPDARKYYEKLLKAGLAKERLDAAVGAYLNK